ncbi:MAG: peptide chain release factor N(5)-glutamine methyltransferase [Candidatus Sumerlaeia bacterium]|nr:peptide chain release factor N(5)-glutamine methyltransferase [Candidatus Sumerlaeia bacterium]
MNLRVGEVVLKSADYLRAKGVESPRLDAELLLAHVLGTDRLKLYMEWDKPLLEIELSAYREAIRRRGADREPVVRILGRREFYGRDFDVVPNVFAPRPETEGLVERATAFLKLNPPPDGRRPTVFDVGTGSGCIITSILAEEPNAEGVASDRSPHALALARRNAHRHRVDQRLVFREGDLFAGYDGPLWVLVSNPPYIAKGQLKGLPPEVGKFDPSLALDGGPDGLDIVRRLAEEGARLVLPGGFVALEFGEEQGLDAAAIFNASGAWGDVRVEQDLAGHDRYLVGRRGRLL